MRDLIRQRKNRPQILNAIFLLSFSLYPSILYAFCFIFQLNEFFSLPACPRPLTNIEQMLSFILFSFSFIASPFTSLMCAHFYRLFFHFTDMSETKNKYLHVTAVKKHGPFLQIIGHHDAHILEELEQNIQNHLPVFRPTVSKLVCPLQYNTVYLANNGGKLYRSVLLKQKHAQSALMVFVDYGIEQEVAVPNVSVQCYAKYRCDGKDVMRKKETST